MRKIKIRLTIALFMIVILCAFFSIKPKAKVVVYDVDLDSVLFVKMKFLPLGTIFDVEEGSQTIRYKVIKEIGYEYDEKYNWYSVTEKGELEMIEVIKYSPHFPLNIPSNIYFGPASYDIEKYNANALVKASKQLRTIKINLQDNNLNVIPRGFLKNAKHLKEIYLNLPKGKIVTFDKKSCIKCGKATSNGLKIRSNWIMQVKFKRNSLKGTDLSQSNVKSIMKKKKHLGVKLRAK